MGSKGKSADLVEIVKQGGDFSKNYGKFWGGLILLSVVNAASGRRPFLWSGLATVGTVAATWVLKNGIAGLTW